MRATRGRPRPGRSHVRSRRPESNRRKVSVAHWPVTSTRLLGGGFAGHRSCGNTVASKAGSGDPCVPPPGIEPGPSGLVAGSPRPTRREWGYETDHLFGCQVAGAPVAIRYLDEIASRRLIIFERRPETSKGRSGFPERPFSEHDVGYVRRVESLQDRCSTARPRWSRRAATFPGTCEDGVSSRVWTSNDETNSNPDPICQTIFIEDC